MTGYDLGHAVTGEGWPQVGVIDYPEQHGLLGKIPGNEGRKPHSSIRDILVSLTESPECIRPLLKKSPHYLRGGRK